MPFFLQHRSLHSSLLFSANLPEKNRPKVASASTSRLPLTDRNRRPGRAENKGRPAARLTGAVLNATLLNERSCPVCTGTARLGSERHSSIWFCLSGCGGVSHHAGDARQRLLTDAMKSEGEEPAHAEMIEWI